MAASTSGALVSPSHANCTAAQRVASTAAPCCTVPGSVPPTLVCRAVGLHPPIDECPRNRHVANIAWAPGRRRHACVLANPSTSRHRPASATKRGSFGFNHSHSRAAMHRSGGHGGQLFSDEFLRSAPPNRSRTAPPMPPAGGTGNAHVLDDPTGVANFHFQFPAPPFEEAEAAADEAAAEEGVELNWSITLLRLETEPVEDTDIGALLLQIASARVGTTGTWAAKCGRALENFVGHHPRNVHKDIVRGRCIEWTNRFLRPLLGVAAKEVEQKDEVCFIRQVHLLAARVAPLVNMTVEELLSKPGMRRGGFGAQAVDPAAALVEFTNFLRITKHASYESQQDLPARLTERCLRWLHCVFLEQRLRFRSLVDTDDQSWLNADPTPSEGAWGTQSTTSAPPEAAPPSPGSRVTTNQYNFGGGERPAQSEVDPPPDAVVVGSVELVGALRNTMIEFKETKARWESSIIVGAMRHCYQEVRHTCKAFRQPGETGLVSLLDNRCPVHTQFANLIVRFLNFTNRSTGRRPGFDRDMSRHAAAYKQQLFFFRNVRLNSNCPTCTEGLTRPICYEVSRVDYSGGDMPCQQKEYGI